MAINRVDITVKSIAELRTVHVAELQDGALAFVVEIEEYFTLVKNAGLPDDGIDQIVPLAGSPRAGASTATWVRLGEDGLSELFCTQSDWYIDPINGADTNNGTTAATALMTHEELRRRLDKCIINQKTTVHILNDIKDNDPVLVDFILGLQGLLIYVGEKPTTILYTGAFTAVAPTNQPTNFQLQVSAPGLGAANLVNTGSTFTRLRIIGAAVASQIGGIGYPAKSIDADTIRINDLKRPYTTLPASFTAPFAPSVGDEFVVENNLTAIFSLTVDILDSSIAQFEPNTRVLFYNIELNHANDQFHPINMVAASRLQFAAASIQFSGCNVAHAGPVNGTRVTFDASKIGEGPDNFAVTEYSQGSVNINASLIIGQLQLKGEYPWSIGGRTLNQAVGFSIFVFVGIIVLGGKATLRRVGIFDGGIGVSIQNGTTVLAQPEGGSTENIYGMTQGSTAVAVNVQEGCQFFWQVQKPTITGSVQVRVGGVDAPLWTTFGDNFTNFSNLATVSRDVL